MDFLSRRSFLTAAALAPAGRLVWAQDQTYTANVNVVNVFATVRNGKGEIVKNLKKEDFLVEDEGKQQTIAYFSTESDLPLTLGLLVDTSESQRGVLLQERIASYKFFDQVLREDKDVAFVIHFDAEVELLRDLTSSRKQLDASLAELRIASPRQLNRREDQQDPGGRRRFGGTALYDAVLLASDELMKKQKGRKAIIVLSDGVDNASQVTLTEAIESAQRADTLIYSILFTDAQEGRANLGAWAPAAGGGRGGRRGGGMPPAQQNRGDGKKVLERLSKETGGGFFEVSKKQPIEKSFAEIQEELRNQYSLGYTPVGNGEPGYRRIRVTTTQKGLIVQARDGYFAGK